MKNLFGVTSVVTGLYQNMGIALFSRSQSMGVSLRQAALRNPGVLMLMIGIALTLMPVAEVHAAGLSSLFDKWGDTVRDGVNLIMTIAAAVGVCAIFYGCKLIWDKSNDRENVKVAHIFLSMGGGALLCILWFVVTTLAETAGDGTVGEAASF